MKKHIIPIVIFVIREKHKYLLTFRTDGKPNDKVDNNIWQIPGGEINFKEKLHDALKRETKEELGIEIEVVKFIPKIFESMRIYWHGLLFCYLCKIKNKNAKITLNKEASRYKWFKAHEIKKLKSFSETYNIILEAEKI